MPRHPGVPDLPDELPLSPIAQLARDLPDVAEWFIRRGEQRLAELAKEAAEADRPAPEERGEEAARAVEDEKKKRPVLYPFSDPDIASAGRGVTEPIVL